MTKEIKVMPTTKTTAENRIKEILTYMLEFPPYEGNYKFQLELVQELNAQLKILEMTYKNKEKFY